MTTRTENAKTPCEIAAEAVVNGLRQSIDTAYKSFNVESQMKADTFRGVMAGYLENKSLRDWCVDLGIDLPEGDRAHR